MNKQFILKMLCALSVLSMTNTAYCNSSTILRDGIIIGLVTSPAILIDGLALPGLGAVAAGILLSKPTTKEEWAGKIITSLATWIAVSMLKSSKSTRSNSDHGDDCNCGNH